MNNTITISALNAYVKSLLDSDSVLTDISLRGEIGNFTRHSKSGHCYFSLRDEKASVKAVMFRQNAQRLGFAPQEGMRVVAFCRVSLYERDGSFQVYVEDMLPDGVGVAQLALEQLKKRLAAEGLFELAHKQMLPEFPQCIGVVTSKTGAALQDIRNVLSRRWPSARILLAPVNVQGVYAAPEIAQGIRRLDEDGRADIIIVGRGGGSQEDLWVFNDERIVRAAYACRTPLVSAVGHEIDFTLLDDVADLRAPTPSAAAEICVPDAAEIRERIYSLRENICKRMGRRLDLCYNAYESLQPRAELAQVREKCIAKQAQLQADVQLLHAHKERLLHTREGQLAHCAALAASLNPYGVLARGYALLENADGQPVTTEQLQVGQRVTVRGGTMDAACTVDALHHAEGETR